MTTVGLQPLTQFRWPSASTLPRESVSHAVPIIRATPVFSEPHDAAHIRPEGFQATLSSAGSAAPQQKQWVYTEASLGSPGSGTAPKAGSTSLPFMHVTAVPTTNGVERSVSSRLLLARESVSPKIEVATREPMRMRSASPPITRAAIDIQTRRPAFAMNAGSLAAPVAVPLSSGSVSAPVTTVPLAASIASSSSAVPSGVSSGVVVPVPVEVLPAQGYPQKVPSSPATAPRVAATVSSLGSLGSSASQPLRSLHNSEAAQDLIGKALPDSPAISTRSRDAIGSLDTEVVSLRSTLASREAQIQELKVLLSKSNAALEEQSAALQERDATIDALTAVSGKVLERAQASPQRRLRPEPEPRKSASEQSQREQPQREPPQRQQSVTKGKALRPSDNESTPARSPSTANGDRSVSPGTRKSLGSASRPRRMLSQERPLKQASATSAEVIDAKRSPGPVKSEDPASDRRSLKSDANLEHLEPDDIDPVIRKFLEEKQVEGLEINRVRKGWYVCQPTGKRVYIKLAGKDRVIVRVGGGYISLQKFVDEYLLPVIQAEEAEAKRVEAPI